MTNPNGLFIQALGLGGQQRADLLNHAQRADYSTISVMDDFELCREIQDGLPNCVVVFRSSTFEPDPGADALPSLIRFLDGIRSQDKRIVIMVNCEAGFNLDRVNMWSDMIETADAMGWRLCVGNTSSGSIKCGQGADANEWLTIGAKLLQTLTKHPGHYLGVHNYTGPFLWIVANGGWGNPYPPPDKIDWSKPQWHLGREAQGITVAAKALGLEALLARKFMIITEGLFDQMDDLAANQDNPYRAIKSNRWRWLTPHWNQWYPGKVAEDVLADQVIWAWEKVYQPLGFVVGVHFFTYRDAGGEWDGDRVDNAPTYLKRMEAYKLQPEKPVLQPMPKPANFKQKISGKALNEAKVYTGPGEWYPRLSKWAAGEIQPSNRVRLYKEAGAPMPSWVFVQIVTGNYAACEGWIQSADFKYIQSETTEVPTVPVPVVFKEYRYPVTVVVTATNEEAALQMVQLIGAVATHSPALLSAVAEATAHISNVKQVQMSVDLPKKVEGA